MNQLSWLCEYYRRPLNNMIEYLAVQEFARIVDSLPESDREQIIREVNSPSTYVSAF